MNPKRALKALLLWIALPVGLVAAAFAFELGVLAICVYALALLFGAARGMVFLWTRPLSVERQLSREVAVVGDHISVVAQLRSSAPWPALWVYAEETVPERTPRDGTTCRLLFIPPGRTFYMSYRLTPIRRGLIQVGPMVLESGDIFGLFKRCRVDQRRDFITTLPPYQIVEDYELGQRRRLGDMPAGRSLFEDPSRIRGIREYQRGDALKRIHWKSSAKRGQLCSKIYDPVTEAGATIALDFNRASWAQARMVKHTATQQAKSTTEPQELGVEIACSIARYLADGGWRVGLFCNGRDPLGLAGATMAQARATDSLVEALEAARQGRRDTRLEPIFIPAGRSPDQFEIIRENLGRVELSDGLPLEEVLTLQLPHIDRSQALVVVAGSAGEDFVSGILRARALGYRIMVFIVCNEEAHTRAFNAFTPHGVDVFHMDEDWRLKEIATGRRHF